jgi:hypothetical protein
MSHQFAEPDGTSSDTEQALFTTEQVPDSPGDFNWFTDLAGPGDIVDAEIVDDGKERSSLKSDIEEPFDTGKAKAGPPALDEWMDFFSRVVIRMATDFYIDAAFSGIDENILTAREIDRVKLTKAERDRMARPFAELSNKLKFTRKHGRTIIASAGTVDAVLQMGMWVSRVNRIKAAVERRQGLPPSRPRRSTSGERIHVRRPQRTQERENVSTEQSAPGGDSSGNGAGKWRPTIAGQVYNPDLG